MTEIDDAIEAAKDVLGGRGNGTYDEALDAISGLLVGISAFRQEVSDAVSKLTYNRRQFTFARGEVLCHLERFVLKAPADPLVEAIAEIGCEWEPEDAEKLRAALAKRGLQVTEIER